MNQFRPIGAVVGRALVGSKGSAVLSVLRIRQVAQKVIFQICADMPRDVQELIKVSTYKNGTLTINAPALVAAELQMRSEGLRAAINEAIGREVVVRLRFKVG